MLKVFVLLAACAPASCCADDFALFQDVEELMTSNIVQALGAMLDTVMF